MDVRNHQEISSDLDLLQNWVNIRQKKSQVNKCKVMFIATRSSEPLLSLIYINGSEKLTANWLSLLTTQNWGSGHGEGRKKKQAKKFYRVLSCAG